MHEHFLKLPPTFTGTTTTEEKGKGGGKAEKKKKEDRQRWAISQFCKILFCHSAITILVVTQTGWLTYSSQLLLKLVACREYLGNFVQSKGPWAPEPFLNPTSPYRHSEGPRIFNFFLVFKGPPVISNRQSRISNGYPVKRPEHL